MPELVKSREPIWKSKPLWVSIAGIIATVISYYYDVNTEIIISEIVAVLGFVFGWNVKKSESNK